jgi:hypothetical protein
MEQQEMKTKCKEKLYLSKPLYIRLFKRQKEMSSLRCCFCFVKLSFILPFPPSDLSVTYTISLQPINPGTANPEKTKFPDMQKI